METPESILEDIVPEEVEASEPQRIAANIIDLAIQVGLLILLYKLVQYNIVVFVLRDGSILKYVIIFGWFISIA